MSENKRNILGRNWNTWSKCKKSELQLLPCAFALIPFLFHPLLSLSFLLSGNSVCQLAAGHKFFVSKILLVYKKTKTKTKQPLRLAKILKKKKNPKHKKRSHFKWSNTASFLFFLVLSCQIAFSLMISHEFQVVVMVLNQNSGISGTYKGCGSAVAYPNPGSLDLRQTLSSVQSKLSVCLMLGDVLHGFCLKRKSPLPPQSLHTGTQNCFTWAESNRSDYIKTSWHNLLQRLS